MVLRKQKEGADTCRFSVDLQNGKTIRIPLIWYKWQEEDLVMFHLKNVFVL